MRVREFDDAYVITVKGAGASLSVLTQIVKEIRAGLKEEDSCPPSVLTRVHNNKINPDFEAQVVIGYTTPVAWEEKYGFDSGVEEIDPRDKLTELQAIFTASDEMAIYYADVSESSEFDGCFEINVPYAP